MARCRSGSGPRTDAGTRRGVPAFATALALLACGGASAQGPVAPAMPRFEVVSIALPPVEAAAVATTFIDAGVPLGRDETARFTLTPAQGVRLFGPAAGDVDAIAGEVPLVPITYAVDAHRPAGRHAVARLVVTRSAGATWEADLWTVVNVRRRLELTVVADPPVVEPGGRLRLAYTLTNRGNAPDSVRLAWDAPEGWSVRPTTDGVVVPEGATVAGEAVADAPAGARPGSVVTIRLNVEGRAGGAVGLAIVTVQAGGGERAELPATLLLGAGPGGAGGAFRAFGVVGDGTRIEASAAYNVAGMSETVPLAEAGVPAFRLGVERPTWRAAIGEGRLQGLPLLGGGFAGAGVEGAWTRGTVTTTVAAFGLPSIAGRPDDRVLHVHARRATDRGLVGTTATVVMRERIPGSPSLIAGGGGTYELPDSPTHRLRIETGLMYMRSAPDSAGAFGPSLVASYELTHRAGGLVARLRQVPAQGPAGEVLPDEAYLGARARLPRDFGAFAWGVRTDGGGITRRLRNDAASAGLDWGRGRARISMAGNVRYTDGLFRDISSTRATFVANAGYHQGQARVDVGFEGGRSVTENDSARDFRAAHVGVHWTAGSSWAWTTLSYRTGEIATGAYHLDVGARLVTGRVQVALGSSASWGWGDMAGTAWASVGWSVTRALEIVAAGRVDRPASAAPAHVTLAIRRRFGVPVPARPAGAAYGRVFEDLDGDGLAGPGDPGIEGIGVRIGGLRAVTGADGSWTIRDAATQSAAPAIDVATLPAGLLPHGQPALAGTGRADLALVRVGTLVVEVFEDADGDGTRGPGERGVEGVLVSVEDATLNARWEQVDDHGRATFVGVAPGLHGVTVRVPAGGARDASERVEAITLSPGGTAALSVSVASSARRIRFNGIERTDGRVQ